MGLSSGMKEFVISRGKDSPYRPLGILLTEAPSAAGVVWMLLRTRDYTKVSLLNLISIKSLIFPAHLSKIILLEM